MNEIAALEKREREGESENENKRGRRWKFEKGRSGECL